ncbi:hypothetical protein E4U53_007832 [Claviceps sorghi]|nr:hypothetical protein E4U53_007832 [Claviceps sorghi]
MAHFVDHPTELFHSPAWACSVRASLGHYAHFINDDGEKCDPIFPGDWVYYLCDDPLYERILELEVSNDDIDITGLVADLNEDEVLLVISHVQYIAKELVLDFCSVATDRFMFSKRDDPSYYHDEKKKRSEPFTKFPARTPLQKRPDDEYICRRAYGYEQDTLIAFGDMPLLRAEMEMRAYGRKWFADTWDRDAPGNENSPPMDFHRYVFKIGDYIEFNHGQIGRVDGVFTYEYNHARRLFIVITTAIITQTLYLLLRLPYVHDGEPMIIGVAAVAPTTGKYIIQDKVIELEATRYLWVTWNLKLI